MMKATKTEKSDWMDRYIVRCLLQGVVLAILLLGGLYLYMNRFEYLHLGEEHPGWGKKSETDTVYLRINKFTGERCIGVGLDQLYTAWECSESFVKDKIIIRLLNPSKG